MPRELRLLDLASAPAWPNPFEDEHVGYWEEFATLLVAFAEQLEKPLRYRDDPTDYIPSQRLAELIDTTGVDGIRYPSAMGPGGTNIVLFKPGAVEIGPSSLVEIVQTKVECREAPGQDC